MFHSWIKQQNKEHLLKNKINEAEKEKLTAHVKEISLKLDLKNLQSPTDIPPLNPVKEENIETIRMPNIPNSKRKASCNDDGPAPKQLKSTRYKLLRFLVTFYLLRTPQIPSRKQPARNRRDHGCQTDLDLEVMEKSIEKAAMERTREEAKIEFDKILDEERKQHLIEVKKLKKKQWCTLCLKEGMKNN